MKRNVILALATIFMISMSVMAQDPITPQQGQNWPKKEMKHLQKPMITPEKRAEKMALTLGLNDSQKADLKALFEKQDAKHHQAMENVKKLKAEMKAKIEIERKANDEELAKILGQEKFQKFQVMRAERIGEMKGRMKERMKENREMHENHFPKSNGEN
jgi:hypothetical protein